MSADGQRDGDLLLDECFAEMKKAHSPVRDASSLSERRARVLPSLQAVVAARGRFRRRVAAAGAGLSIAAAAAAGFLMFDVWPSDEGAKSARVFGTGNVEFQKTEGSSWNTVDESASVSSGGGVRTPLGAHAQLHTKNGVKLALSSESELRMGLDRSTVQLDRGTVVVDVPRLGAGEAFSVTSKKAELVVHGTRFSVTVREEAALPCVVVQEGVVEFVAEADSTWLRAGQSKGCELPSAAERSEQDSQPEQADPESQGVDTQQPSQKSARGHSAPSRATPLSRQNALFQKALSAEREGEMQEAIRLLDRLIARYPKSPLLEQARAQKKVVLERAKARGKE